MSVVSSRLEYVLVAVTCWALAACGQESALTTGAPAGSAPIATAQGTQPAAPGGQAKRVDAHEARAVATLLAASVPASTQDALAAAAADLLALADAAGEGAPQGRAALDAAAQAATGAIARWGGDAGALRAARAPWARALARLEDSAAGSLLAAARYAAAALAGACQALAHDAPAGDGAAEVAAAAGAAEARLAQLAPAADRGRYSFTQYWFDNSVAAWGPRTRHLRGQPFSGLEIGSFEGASTTYILDELMAHPDSRLVAVDTFAGAMDHQPRPTGPDYQLATLFDRFQHNVKQSPRFGQLEIMRHSSIDAAITLRQRGARFDFIYIDGSHTAGDVLHDAVALWPMLNEGGTMLFDDVDWTLYTQPHYNPGIAIDSFLRCYRPEVRFAKDHGQMWVTRVANEDPPQQAFEWGH